MLLLAQLVDKDLDTMKIKNGDLMTFHAVALSLREFCDVRTHLCLAKRSPLGSRRFLCAGAAGGGQAGLGWRCRVAQCAVPVTGKVDNVMLVCAKSFAPQLLTVRSRVGTNKLCTFNFNLFYKADKCSMSLI